MFITAKNPLIYQVIVDDILAALSARPAGALMASGNVHLFVNNTTVIPSRVLADFTEATFTGYSAQALPALIGPFNADGNARGMHGETSFIASATPSPSVLIYGAYLTDSANAVLWAAERFDTPVPIALAGDMVTYDFIFPEPYARPIG